MSNGKIGIGEPATPDQYLATYTFSEDALTKLLQRFVISTSSGAEVDWSAAAQVEGLTGNGAAGNPAPLVFGGRTGAGNTVTAAISAGGNLLVEPGGTFNVTAAQSGTWSVTGSGSAGTPAAGVLTIQGVASMTPVITGGAVADNAVAFGNPNPIGGTANSTLPTYSVGDRVEAQFSTRGAQYVSLVEPTGGSFITASSNGGDALTNNITCLHFLSRGALYNGSTWDRSRGIAGSFGAATGVAAVEQAGATWTRIATNQAVTNVKASAGILHKVVINTKGASANVLSLYDTATTTTGTPIAVIDTTEATRNFVYDLGFTNGLAVGLATGTAADITIVYR